MEFFTLENEKPILNPAIRNIGLFKKIIARDQGSKGDSQGRAKLQASKELAFIYFKYNPRSFFLEQFQGKELDAQIKKHLGLEDEWEEDELVRDAGEFYKQMNTTITVKTLNTARSSLFYLCDLLEKYQGRLSELMKSEVKLDTEQDKAMEDERVKFFIDNGKKITELVTNIPKTIKTLEELKEKVSREVETKIGKREVGVGEDPGFFNLEDNG